MQQKLVHTVSGSDRNRALHLFYSFRRRKALDLALFSTFQVPFSWSHVEFDIFICFGGWSRLVRKDFWGQVPVSPSTCSTLGILRSLNADLSVQVPVFVAVLDFLGFGRI